LDGDEGEDEEDLVPLKKSSSFGNAGPGPGPSLQPLAEEKLILSDDDIVDD
jgi:hypothetical protein